MNAVCSFANYNAGARRVCSTANLKAISGKMTEKVESAAIALLKKAVEYDSSDRYTESLSCYQEGIQLLIDVMKGCSESKRQVLRLKVGTYMDRAEKIKQLIDTETGSTHHKQIVIQKNATGFSYERIFNPLLIKCRCERVDIEDPYIRSHHQISNFLRFCELLVKAKCGVKFIHLKTGRDQAQHNAQVDKLGQVTDSLRKHDITLLIEYSDSLHDREIRLSSGWVIKIGRGLDYFKPADDKFSIGQYDYDLRQCHETTVDIYRHLPT